MRLKGRGLGLIAAALTFPGVVVHEMAHTAMCRLLGVRVVKVCYLRLGNPPGYVLHERPQSLLKQVLISVGPLIFNTLAGAAAGLPFALKTGDLWVRLALLWLGFAFAAHSFPSTGDAASVWQSIWRKGVPIYARAAAVPVVAAIYLGALGRVFWLDFVYGAAVVWIGPRWLSAMCNV